MTADGDEDDVARLSDAQLADILTHIDRERFVERYVAVRNEYARRLGLDAADPGLDERLDFARLHRPFVERSILYKTCLLILLAWVALMLAIRGIIYLVSG